PHPLLLHSRFRPPRRLFPLHPQEIPRPPLPLIRLLTLRRRASAPIPSEKFIDLGSDRSCIPPVIFCGPQSRHISRYIYRSLAEVCRPDLRRVTHEVGFEVCHDCSIRCRWFFRFACSEQSTCRHLET